VFSPPTRRMFLLARKRLLLLSVVASIHLFCNVHQVKQITDGDDLIQEQSYRIINDAAQGRNPRNVVIRQTQRRLPLFNETGGLIVFIHIAKTGGSTIRESFRKHSNISIMRVMNEGQLISKQDKITRYLSSTGSNSTMTIDGRKGKVILMLEIHGNHGEPITIFHLHPYIQQWKTLADNSRKNFFVFAMLREPAAFHVSYFTFFQHPNCQELWCDRQVLPQTEEHLLQSMIPNHQCRYLARIFNKTENHATTPVTKGECNLVHTLLLKDVDWIGTTASLNQTTLPLLTYIVTGRVGQSLPMVINKQNIFKKMQLAHLSDAAKQKIRKVSNLDQYLYDAVRQEYTFDMWTNLHPFDSKCYEND
jgi:hypothetical protein